MSIDWITVTAQLLNFLILIWLLKRFLYRPILDGIDAREREIAERMAEAGKARVAAEHAEADYRERAAGLQAERERALQADREAAEAARAALLAEAQEQLDREHAARKSERVEEARRYGAELQRSGADALLSLLRKALADLADESLEQRLALHTAARLEGLSDDLKRAAGEVREGIVTTREPLTDETRERIEAALAKALPGVTLHYRIDPTRSTGLRLRLGGARLDWSLDDYVDALQAQLEQGLALPAEKRSDAA